MVCGGACDDLAGCPRLFTTCSYSLLVPNMPPLPPFISKSLGRSSLPGSDVHDAASMAILFYFLIPQFRSTVKTE